MLKTQFARPLVIATALMFSSSCNLPGKEDASDDKTSVSSIHMTPTGTLKVKGHVGQIKKIQLKTDSGVVPFKIINHEKGILEIAATSILKLSPGKIYGLVVSSAGADEMIIPIQLDMPVQGPVGPAGAAGAPGTNGAAGPQGPVGPPGRGASIVIKDANGQTAAYFMTQLPTTTSYFNISQKALFMLASTKQILEIDLLTGSIAKEGGFMIFYSGANCTGNTYFEVDFGSHLPVLGRVVRAANQYFEITGFERNVTVLSNVYYNGVNPEHCRSETRTIGNPTYGRYAPVLQSIAAPQSFESLAPIRLQLE